MTFDFTRPAVPRVEPESCTNCGQCAEICPSQTLTVVDGKLRVEAGIFTGCIGCTHCMMVCPTGSVTVEGRRLAPEDIGELPPVEARATADQLEALLSARRSVRRFSEEEVDRRVAERIVEMVRTAPMGIPPSEVGIVVFHGRDKVRQFAEDAVEGFRKVARFLNPLVLALMRPFIGRAQYAVMRQFVRPVLDLIVKRWDEGADDFCYEAPLAMLFHHCPTGDPADDHIAATYAMLAAQSLGLGSCLLGTTVALDHDRVFKAKCGIPQQNKISLGLVIGHPRTHFRRSIRRQLASVHFV